MDQDEIIAMAKEAGACEPHWAARGAKDSYTFGDASLTRFAALVAAKEREACALVADIQHFGGEADDDLLWTACAAHIAAAIRARGAA